MAAVSRAFEPLREPFASLAGLQMSEVYHHPTLIDTLTLVEEEHDSIGICDSVLDMITPFVSRSDVYENRVFDSIVASTEVCLLLYSG